MGLRNVLVEGGSGAGKTAVCDELQSRGFHAVHGDRELAVRTGGPSTARSAAEVHGAHRWDPALVRRLTVDRSAPVTFLCGGARNHDEFLELIDDVVVLSADLATIRARLDARPVDEWGGPGRDEERALIERLHRTGEDIPPRGIAIDSSGPVAETVDAILRRLGLDGSAPGVSTRGR